METGKRGGGSAENGPYDQVKQSRRGNLTWGMCYLQENRRLVGS